LRNNDHPGEQHSAQEPGKRETLGAVSHAPKGEEQKAHENFVTLTETLVL